MEYRCQYNMTLTPYDGFGLKNRPSVEPTYSDDDDFTKMCYDAIRYEYEVLPEDKHPDVKIQEAMDFTLCNARELKSEFGKIRDTANAILEIGVCGHEPEWIYSSTDALLSVKRDETIYVGIDRGPRDRWKNPEKNVYTIQSDSSDYVKVASEFDSLGVDSFDFIFIDGWHSINQVMKDWWYVEKYLKVGGCVGMHDIHYHSGPSCVFSQIDEEYFDKYVPHCTWGGDWGIGFAWLRKRI